jgi:hypothetical protein
MGTPIRVEKCKWDGQVSASEPAYAVTSTPSVQAWFVPSGTRRARPMLRTTESLVRDQLWVTAVDEWWVLCASARGDAITDLVMHAAVPVEPAAQGVVMWIDLDLDLEIHDGRISLEDIDVFQDHAATMAYPNDVIRGAWSGISRLAPRLTTREWPFDGWLDQLLARVRHEVGQRPYAAWRLEQRAPQPPFGSALVP